MCIFLCIPNRDKLLQVRNYFVKSELYFQSCSHRTSEHQFGICRSCPFHLISPVSHILAWQMFLRCAAEYLGPKMKSLSSRTCPKQPNHCCSKEKRGTNLGQLSQRCCRVSSAWQKTHWLPAPATCLFVATAPMHHPPLEICTVYLNGRFVQRPPAVSGRWPWHQHTRPPRLPDPSKRSSIKNFNSYYIEAALGHFAEVRQLWCSKRKQSPASLLLLFHCSTNR